MANCGFKTDITYYDENARKHIPYVCPELENILDSGLCMYHDQDPTIKEAYKQTIQIELTKKIQDSKPLICIGYYLPDFSFEKLHFDKLVDFSQAVFMGAANFSNAKFKEADFSGAQFEEEADFSGAQFEEEANFYYAKFNR